MALQLEDSEGYRLNLPWADTHLNTTPGGNVAGYK
jgi:hypothetical protein